MAALGARPDEEDTDRETLIRDLMEGHYRRPTRIVAFNTAEGWSRDVTMDELRRRFAEYDEVPSHPFGAWIATAEARSLAFGIAIGIIPVATGLLSMYDELNNGSS